MDDPSHAPTTLLITLTGVDRPGVTTEVLRTAAAYGVDVVDIEQIVLRGRLVLGVLVTAPRSWPALADAVRKVAADLDMDVTVDKGTGDNRARRKGRSHVTVLGSPLRAAAVSAITGRVADVGANIDRIERMARYPVTALELHVSGVDPDRLRLVLAEEAARQEVDVAVQPANLLRHGMRLIVMDVDSTLVQGEVIEMLAEHAGCLEEVAEVTEAGEVTLDGVTARGSESVALGQTLVWNRPPWNEPDCPRHFDVLFEDPYLLAVDKPSGLPTIPGGGYMENTLLRLVQRNNPNANPVHRLGRATSGIVLFAKTSRAASNLFAKWNTPDIRKIYRALARNVARQDAYEILTPIGLVPHPLIGSVWAANPSGKPAKSVANVISRAAGATTFEVSLHSGRPHQIRIHLASIGHPLVGDPLYGATGQPLENLPGLPGDGGYFLHAQYLKFHHPITGEQIDLEAALPSGFPLHG